MLLSLGRCKEPSYLVVMYLARPWYTVSSWHGSLRACISFDLYSVCNLVVVRLRLCQSFHGGGV